MHLQATVDQSFTQPVSVMAVYLTFYSHIDNEWYRRIREEKKEYKRVFLLRKLLQHRIKARFIASYEESFEKSFQNMTKLPKYTDFYHSYR